MKKRQQREIEQMMEFEMAVAKMQAEQHRLQALDAEKQKKRKKEREMKKKEAGKDIAQFDNIVQDADDKAPDQEARVDEPLVKQPELTGGDQPGVPAEMKKKQPKTESEFIQRLKTLSGQN